MPSILLNLSAIHRTMVSGYNLLCGVQARRTEHGYRGPCYDHTCRNITGTWEKLDLLPLAAVQSVHRAKSMVSRLSIDVKSRSHVVGPVATTD